MNSQSFTKGVDFTAVSPVTGADLNNLIELGVPTADTAASNGKGLALITDDTALDTPSVPDASVTTLWKRFVWFRRPHADSESTGLIPYAWNDNADSDATFLKWVKLDTDSEELETLTALANNALSTAQAAVTVAETASAQSTSALTTATEANATADEALSDAAVAQTTANTANTAANTATANVAALSAIVAALGANLSQVFIAREVQASGVSAGAAVTGANKRALNTEINAATFAVFTGGSTNTVTLEAGVYLVQAWATGKDIDHQTVLWDVTNNVIANSQMKGTSIEANTVTDINTVSYMTGVLTVGSSTAYELRTYSGQNVATDGLGNQTSLTYGECYSEIVIRKIAAV